MTSLSRVKEARVDAGLGGQGWPETAVAFYVATERTVRVQYRDCYGTGRQTTGALLDLCPAGPVLGISGAKSVICWDSLRLLELVGD
jgi:hypothetical protein